MDPATDVDAPHRVLLIYGTRPEAIKMAPLVAGLRAATDLEPLVVVTGQHRQMLDQVNALFGIEPDVDLDILSPGQGLDEITSRALTGVGRTIAEHRPDAVVVQGDTSTAFAGAMSAFHAQVPVAHLEAGLRTADRYAPFPEEINRRLVSQLASLHLAPTASARANLIAEAVPAEDVVVTGNTVIDALFAVSGRQQAYSDPAVDELVTSGRRVVLVTTHRRESWGQPMRDAVAAIARVACARPDTTVVVPLHRNPVVRDAVTAELRDLDGVLLTDPLPYAEFARLMNDAYLVVTDSGGIQEEAPSLGKPVLVLRDKTERPEAVDAGTVELVGTDPSAVVTALSKLLDDESAYARMARASNPYGDGKAATRCVSALTYLLMGRGRPPDFASDSA